MTNETTTYERSKTARELLVRWLQLWDNNELQPHHSVCGDSIDLVVEDTRLLLEKPA